MKAKTFTIFIISLCLLLTFQPLFSSTALASRPPQSVQDKPLLKIIANGVSQIYNIVFGFNIGSGRDPKYVYSVPDVIEIGYLENISTTVIFGNPKRNLSGYQANVNYETDISFDVDFPPEVPTDAFSVYFDPPLIDLSVYHQQKIDEGFTDPDLPNPRTTMYLKLEMPIDPSNPIEDFILTVNMTYKNKYRNFWETKAFGTPIGPFKTPGILSSLAFVQAFGETGTQNRYGEIFVKMKPFRYAEMNILESQPISMRLNDIKTAQVQVENRGNYPEQYGFRIQGQSGSLNVNTPPPFTLYPGESRTIQIGLITKPFAYDRGTLHSVDIELYPHDNPNTTLANSTISIRTQGFALQSVFRFRFSWHIFFAVSILLFILIVLAIYRRIRIRQLRQKPRKPWTLPEEKQHLQKLLQKKDKKTYEHELNMMKQEYQSSLLTHKTQLKHDLKQLRKQSRIYRLFGKILTVPKLPKPSPKPKKEKNKKKPTTKTQTKQKTQKKQPKTTKPIKTSRPTLSKDLQKQQLMEKIKKQQTNSR